MQRDANEPCLRQATPLADSFSHPGLQSQHCRSLQHSTRLQKTPLFLLVLARCLDVQHVAPWRALQSVIAWPRGKTGGERRFLGCTATGETHPTGRGRTTRGATRQLGFASSPRTASPGTRPVPMPTQDSHVGTALSLAGAVIRAPQSQPLLMPSEAAPQPSGDRAQPRLRGAPRGSWGGTLPRRKHRAGGRPPPPEPPAPAGRAARREPRPPSTRRPRGWRRLSPGPSAHRQPRRHRRP